MDHKPEPTNEEWIARLRSVFSSRGIPMEPTANIGGIRIDFCYGVRILFPSFIEKKRYRVEIADLDHNLKMFDQVLESGDYYVSKRRYFVRYGVKITPLDEDGSYYSYDYDAKGKQVVVDMPVPTMGDSIAWFSCCEKFRELHGCDLYVCMPEHVRPLFVSEYPDIHFVTREEKSKLSPYAHYTLGIFMDDEDGADCPIDYRQCALHHYGAYLLGMNPEDADNPPRIAQSEKKREIKEPYVCIATQASGMCKTWVHPFGWDAVVKFLKKSGYRVIDIDQQAIAGGGIHWHPIPREAEDFTGNIPLAERAELIRHADFFVGLGSGLSWLAWCCKVPVVLISGFSLPSAEFHTPYRVINMNVCHGCFSDPRYRFVNSEFDWCPKHKGTARHYECTRGITPQEVIRTIERIPEFQKHCSISNKGE